MKTENANNSTKYSNGDVISYKNRKYKIEFHSFETRKNLQAIYKEHYLLIGAKGAVKQLSVDINNNDIIFKM